MIMKFTKLENISAGLSLHDVTPPHSGCIHPGKDVVRRQISWSDVTHVSADLLRGDATGRRRVRTSLR